MAFGDGGPGDTHQWAVGRPAAAQDPDVAVVAGDLVSPRRRRSSAASSAPTRSWAGAPLYGTGREHDLA